MPGSKIDVIHNNIIKEQGFMFLTCLTKFAILGILVEFISNLNH